MTTLEYDARAEHLKGERQTCYGAFVLLVLIAPAVILKNGFAGWLGSLRLMRENLAVVRAEEVRLRAAVKR